MLWDRNIFDSRWERMQQKFERMKDIEEACKDTIIETGGFVRQFEYEEERDDYIADVVRSVKKKLLLDDGEIDYAYEYVRDLSPFNSGNN